MKKYEIIAEVQAEVEKLDRQYDRGLITKDEQYAQRVEAWTGARDRVSKAVTEGLDKFGSIYMMATSGAAKGQFTQISQLAGMRGLMADPQGQIIDLPIKSNFREGLSVLDYFISTHGARKGLADTALRTAESGYLTRRLIDVGQDVIVYVEDCGTNRGMWVSEGDSGEKLERRITGRGTVRDVVHPKTGEVVIGENQEITETLASTFVDALRAHREKVQNVGDVLAESIMKGLRNATVEERGTATLLSSPEGRSLRPHADKIRQLSDLLANTFLEALHLLGDRTHDISDRLVDGFVEGLRAHPLVADLQLNPIVDVLRSEEGPDYKLTRALAAMVIGNLRTHKLVDMLGAHAAKNQDITKALSGLLVDALRASDHENQRGLYVRSVLNCLAKRGVCRHCYGWSMATRNLVTEGEAVGIIAAESIGEPGTQLTMRTFHTGGIAGEDITQGLPRVEELFEAREPKDKAVISEIDGVVEIVKDEDDQHVRVTSKRDCRDVYSLPRGFELLVVADSEVDVNQVLARPVSETEPVAPTTTTPAVVEDTSEQIVSRHKGKIAISDGKITVYYEDVDTRLYQVGKVARLRVENGKKVLAGTQLTEGSVGPQDLLEIQGPEAVQKYLVAEVQRVYRSQGVGINDKHVEVIVRQMLRKVKIEDAGDTELLPGELVDRFVFEDINARVLAQDGQPAIAKAVLLGVTKASLNTDSFLAAASFQETTRVLTEAAISGKKDRLMGLKENVIIGKLIPAGSGLMSRRTQMAEEDAEEQLFQSGGVAMLERGGDGLGAFDDGLDSAAPDIFGDMPDELEDLDVEPGELDIE